MKKVAIIDDDQGVIEALQAALELWDYECVGIQEKVNKKIVAHLLKTEPNLIFLDLLLSGTDGPSVAADIRQAPALMDTPIILMSAHPRGKEIATQIKVNGFLPKPFSLDQLQSLIAKVLPE